MRKITLFLFMSILSIGLHAQDIQWAYRVLEYSSQESESDFAARQVLGKPNVFPSAGENRNAWQPKDKSSEQYITVGFLTPIIPKQIVVAETNHPGAIQRVLVYDADGKEYEISSYQNTATTDNSRLLSIKTTGINFYIFSVKLILKATDKGLPGIDAIGISASTKTIKIAKANTNDLIKSNMVVTKLSDHINSPYPEIGPLVSPDGRTLYFSRRGDPKDKGGKGDLEDIWYAKWDESKQNWGEAEDMGPPLNNAEPNFINSVSPDGNTVLLGNSYNEDGSMGDGVSVSHKTKDGWSFPERLQIKYEQNSNVRANFFMSNSQKILLMSVERKHDGNIGGRDLYVSFLEPDNTWTKPLNLGNTVNTKATEEAPFLASDDRTLYYATDGLNGYGGTDIYVTRRLDDSWTNWSTPENLGPVVNTSRNESYLSITASGEKVYFTSEKMKEGDADIYVLQPPALLKPSAVTMITGRVLNSKTNDVIPGVKIFFENLDTGTEVGIASSDINDGNYQIILPSQKRYGYLAVKDGFISINDNIDLVGQNQYNEIQRDLYLTPIEVGQTITLKNIFFDFNKASLRKESHLELNRLAKLLKENPALKIEVDGNTDNIGTEQYNDKLSLQRAQTVANYLIKQSGADSSRITLKHYGETDPVSTNATAKGRQLNRRVEFKILAK
ncbi:MAG TPA: OmpA family protein [Cytophagaceae bacterium]|jgi:OOP family OmpA-OmpF porin|nr:OmpA family protein [Cytophagaceae bacterium]